MATIKAVFADVLSRIKPSPGEAALLDKRLKAFAKVLAMRGATIEIGGSTAKNTWLRGNHDADFFVKFNYHTYKDQSDKLSDLLHRSLRKLGFRAERIHGSRDYFQVHEESFTYEIIPILNITKPSMAKNITDASPLHAAWVCKHPKLSDDIRLAKQFCKANGIYGAESYIGGFSGYVLEILVIYYKGFARMLRASTTWKSPVIIDYAHHHKNPLLEINKSKIQGPLVVVDPVEPGRNAAAAVSEESFLQFKALARAFLAKPSATYFFREKETPQTILSKNRKNIAYLISLTLDKGKHDVVGSRITRYLHSFTKRFAKEGFKVKDHGFIWTEPRHSTLYIILDPAKMPGPTKQVLGPPAAMAEHAVAFRRKHSNAKKIKSRWVATIKTSFTDPDRLLKDLLKRTPKEGFISLKSQIQRP